MTDTLRSDTPSRSPSPGAAARPRRTWTIAIVVVSVVALVGGVVWLATSGGGPSEPPAFDSSCGTVVHAQGEARARVLLVGDSLMQQPSCELAAALAGDGVETHMHAIPGSGLLAGVDWVSRFNRLLASVHPDVVVALFVGNYIGPPAIDFSGQPIAADTDLFFAFWQQRAAEMSRRAREAGARLYWVEPPPIEDGGRAARLDAGYARLGDDTLPSGRALAGPGGQWVESVPGCEDGQPLRTADGIHLTPVGAHVFARALAHDLASSLDLSPLAPAC